MVDRLHQQGPILFRQACEGTLIEGAVADLPGTLGALFFHQTRLDIVFTGKSCQLIGRQGVVEVREGATNQQWRLLPVVPEKIGG